jgi:hypothetical protein
MKGIYVERYPGRDYLTLTLDGFVHLISVNDAWDILIELEQALKSGVSDPAASASEEHKGDEHAPLPSPGEK